MDNLESNRNKVYYNYNYDLNGEKVYFYDNHNPYKINLEKGKQNRLSEETASNVKRDSSYYRKKYEEEKLQKKKFPKRI